MAHFIKEVKQWDCLAAAQNHLQHNPISRRLTSQTVGDLAKGNIQSAGDVTVNGFYGEDLENFLNVISGVTDNATSSNSNLAGQSIQQVAQAYQSAYSETTGMLQQLKPVLMVGVSVLALFMIPKIWRKL